MTNAVLEDTTPSDGFSPNIVAVGGGKGGIGKSFLSASLAYALARRGSRVLVVDLDLGGANLHAWFGTPPVPEKDLGSFLRRGGIELEDLVLPGHVPGLSLIHGATTNLSAQNLKHAVKLKLISRLRRMHYDWIVLDLGAGTDYNMIDFFLMSTRGVMALTPEKTSIENGYRFLRAVVLRLLKNISQNAAYQDVLKAVETDFTRVNNVRKLLTKLQEVDAEKAANIERIVRHFRSGLVINQVWEMHEIRIAEHVKLASERHLVLSPRFYGPVRYDETVARLLRKSKSPIDEVFNLEGVRDDIMTIADNIIRDINFVGAGLSGMPT